MPHVPAGHGESKTLGPFSYGDYDVKLIDCKTCGGVYATGAEGEHSGTLTHKGSTLAASAK